MEEELVLSIGEKMNRENMLTDKGLRHLYAERSDIYQRCLYMAIVLCMADLYGDYIERKKQDRTAYVRIRPIAIYYGTLLPILFKNVLDMNKFDKEFTESFV